MPTATATATGTRTGTGRHSPDMIELDIAEQIAALRATFADIRSVVGVDRLSAEIAQLSKEAGVPDLWVMWTGVAS